MAETQTVDPAATQGNPQSAIVPEGEGSVLTGTNVASESPVPAKEAPKATATAPAWTAQLEKDLQSDAALTKFQTLSELGKGYKELEGKLGKAIIPPGENASAEDIKAYREKLGVPDSPDNYTLDSGKLPEQLRSTDLEKNFRSWAHELGLTNVQASELYTRYNGEAMQFLVSQNQLIAAKAEQTRRALREEWGAEYKAKMASMERAFALYGSNDIAKVMIASGAGNDPNVVKMFAKIGEQLREGPTIRAEGGNAPTKSIADILYPGVAK